MNEKTLAEVLAEEVEGIASLLRPGEHLTLDDEANLSLIRKKTVATEDKLATEEIIIAKNGRAIEILTEVLPF